jgi:chromatin remodeling complex protein RSC6
MSEQKRPAHKASRGRKVPPPSIKIPDVTEVMSESSSASAVQAPPAPRARDRKREEKPREEKQKKPREEKPREEKSREQSTKNKVEKKAQKIPMTEEALDATTAVKRERRVKTEKTETPTEMDATEVVLEDSRKSSKKMVSREELEDRFDSFLTLLNSELDATRSEKNRKVSVRNWRLLLKEAKQLKLSSIRAMKKPKKRDTSNIASGLLKPVPISLEMAQFTGWDPSELKSRVDVTKHLCKYIKTNQLQNPDDKRQIIADEQLATLLNFDRSSDDKLTYPTIQKRMKHHFPKPE